MGTSRSEAFNVFVDNLLEAKRQRPWRQRPRSLDLTDRSTTASPHRTINDQENSPAALEDSSLEVDLEVQCRLEAEAFLEDFGWGRLHHYMQYQKLMWSSKTKWTPLHYAALVGKLDLCRVILEKGASVDAREDHDFTPLMFAAMRGQLETCNLLLDFGADINADAYKGRTALSEACAYGGSETTELLISKGADLEASGEDGLTPLILTITCVAQDLGERQMMQGDRFSEEGPYNTVKLLLENGCDPDGPDNTGFALELAMAYGLYSIVELLLDHGADPNIRHDEQRTPLIEAALNCDPVMVQLLLEHGADPRSRSESDWTALHYAAQNEDESKDSLGVIKLLIDTAEVDINAVQDKSATALYLAVQANSFDTVNFLLDENADPNIVTEVDASPLEKAVSISSLRIVDLLLARGADITRVDKRGRSILHEAARQKDVDVLKRILDEDIDIELKSTEPGQLTALQLAVQNDNDQIPMTLLKYYGAQPY
ncbi:ankyrin repeat-containing domain protein [Nemania sp. FL0916]|nr:ankyrin repeat-containing domain protein [Nemania sp. FL0916]